MERGFYHEIKQNTLEPEVRAQVKTLVDRASNATKLDEHGNWDFGFTSLNRKGTRWSALNWDLYGFGYDIHTQQFLIVIQVREADGSRKWLRVRKNYFLIGENEDGTVFAHAVESRVVHNAVKKCLDVVRAVQNWIFGGEYDAMFRQGDVALLKMWETPRAQRISGVERIVLNSHQLVGSQMRENGNLYVKDPVMVHIPGTHPPVGGRGWYRVVIGQRADFWKFAAPTKD